MNNTMTLPSVSAVNEPSTPNQTATTAAVPRKLGLRVTAFSWNHIALIGIVLTLAALTAKVLFSLDQLGNSFDALLQELGHLS